MKNRQNGITLIALVITIIILLILAGVSISVLTDSGIFEKAKLAKEKSENAQVEENETLSEYENIMNGYLSGTGGSSSGDSTGGNGGQTSVEEQPATTLAEAQSDDMFAKKVNSTIEDTNGNKIVVPAGFKITTDATTANKGIVIIDANGNEFVWIPVGTIYTNAEKTEYKTVTLNRYSFNSAGKATAVNDAIAANYYQELATSTYGNTTAKNIEEFKTSVATNGGYYIGRYEARTATARSSSSDTITTITENGTQYVYNYVTQIQAADLARNMYDNTKPFTSDLMNSYAWDTAILFLQECGDNSIYSKQKTVNTSLAETGTNNQSSKDVQCNVYDMASNLAEHTTESNNITDVPYITCTIRGGDFNKTRLLIFG